MANAEMFCAYNIHISNYIYTPITLHTHIYIHICIVIVCICETISTYIILNNKIHYTSICKNLVWIGNGSLCHGDPSMPPWGHPSNTSAASGYWFNELEHRLQYLIFLMVYQFFLSTTSFFWWFISRVSHYNHIPWKLNTRYSPTDTWVLDLVILGAHMQGYPIQVRISLSENDVPKGSALLNRENDDLSNGFRGTLCSDNITHVHRILHDKPCILG